MKAKTKERWLELCEQAANEQDPKKFLAIVQEINTLLEAKRSRFKQSGPQLVPSDLARCQVCDEPVPLEASKTDENGKAVHEECYAIKVRLRQTTTPSNP